MTILRFWQRLDYGRGCVLEIWCKDAGDAEAARASTNLKEIGRR